MRSGDVTAPFVLQSGGLLASVREQILRPRVLLPVAAALVLLYLGARFLLNVPLAAIWAEIQQADLVLLGLAIAVFYLTFPLRALRWRAVLQGAGYRDLPSPGRMIQLMVLAGFANSVTVAQLGDVYRAYLLKRGTTVSLPAAFGSILAERLVDIVTMVALLSGATFAVYGGRMPGDSGNVLLAGAGIAVLGVAGLLLMPRLRGPIERFVPARSHAVYARFVEGANGALRRPFQPLLFSSLAWLVEGLTLYLLGAALGIALPPAGALVAALIAALLSVEPITPGGLGVTEPGIVIVLSSLGVDPAGAGAIAVLNRFVNYVSLAAAGAAVAAFGRRGEQIEAAPKVGATIPAVRPVTVIREG